MNCYLCFEPFDHSIRKPYHLTCPHSFCISCLNHLKKETCPICQKKITEKNPNIALLEFIPESKYDKLKSETLDIIIQLNENKLDLKSNIDTKRSFNKIRLIKRLHQKRNNKTNEFIKKESSKSFKSIESDSN